MKLVPRTRKNRLFNDREFFAPFSPAIDQLFQNVLDRDFFSLDRSVAFNPALDVEETENDYQVTLEVPGVDPNELDISMEASVLTIRGKKKQENEKKDKNYHRIERSFGSFSRSLTFPADVDGEKVEAKYNNGVLQLTIPKSEAAKPKRIEIKAEK